LASRVAGTFLLVEELSTFTYTIPDRLDALRGLRAALRVWLAEAGVDDETAEDAVLAAWEVCANAVEHPVDPRQPPEVTFVASVGPTGLLMVVVDSGSWRDRDTPRAGRGLGLRLARAMVDRLSIHSHRPGTEVVLWRSRGDHA
jgi:anti-sigma regulatory factor (Ser/Thr protein kinase)